MNDKIDIKVKKATETTAGGLKLYDLQVKFDVKDENFFYYRGSIIFNGFLQNVYRKAVASDMPGYLMSEIVLQYSPPSKGREIEYLKRDIYDAEAVKITSKTGTITIRGLNDCMYVLFGYFTVNPTSKDGGEIDFYNDERYKESIQFKVSNDKFIKTIVAWINDDGNVSVSTATEDNMRKVVEYCVAKAKKKYEQPFIDSLNYKLFEKDGEFVFTLTSNWSPFNDKVYLAIFNFDNDLPRFKKRRTKAGNVRFLDNVKGKPILSLINVRRSASKARESLDYGFLSDIIVLNKYLDTRKQPIVILVYYNANLLDALYIFENKTGKFDRERLSFNAAVSLYNKLPRGAV